MDTDNELSQLTIPSQAYFQKSPAGTPRKVLKHLDLLSVDGFFVPNHGHSGPSTAQSSLACTPRRRFSIHHDDAINRRKSFTSDVVYDQTVSDEFAHINLTIKENRRHSTVASHYCPKPSYFVNSCAPNPRHPRMMYGRNSNDNPVIIAKVLTEDDEEIEIEDEIEIVDLDDDDDSVYVSSFQSQKTPLSNLYPNCDVNVWLRSCEEEIIEPIDGCITGVIPLWLKGSLLRNGPGSIKVGEMTYNHLFDSAALLHRFNIIDGRVTYQNKFLKSETYKKNLAANRIVVSEFGTVTVPDPCLSIFQRVSALFKPAEANSDNAMISIYPFGDEYFAFTESPVIHRICPNTLDTLDKINLTEHIGIVNHTSHPHVMADGTVYNLGMSVGKTGPAYNIICFPHGEKMFENARVVAEIPTRWKLHPSYMHTFGITDNYFIIVEQPLTISVPAVIKSQIKNEPMISCLKWFPDKQTFIYLIDRDSGELKHTFQTEAFFYLHIINQYEKDNHVVIDICCYRDPEMLNCMYIDTMRDMQSNPDYARMFRGRPLRFVLPLNYPIKQNPLKNFFKQDSEDIDEEKLELLSNNLVTLKDSGASAYALPDGSVFCKPQLLCSMGCETPRINYEKNLGTEYQYFYAISADVDADNPGTLIKVDVKNKNKLTWSENKCYPSEPIFIANPNSECEDDGIILASMVWGHGEENRVGLLILCAKTMEELGRAEFKNLSGPVPKCLHGWFAPHKE
ncbi:unnamed protein product [Diamesa serratosioi]